MPAPVNHSSVARRLDPRGHRDGIVAHQALVAIHGEVVAHAIQDQALAPIAHVETGVARRGPIVPVAGRIGPIAIEFPPADKVGVGRVSGDGADEPQNDCHGQNHQSLTHGRPPSRKPVVTLLPRPAQKPPAVPDGVGTLPLISGLRPADRSNEPLTEHPNGTSYDRDWPGHRRPGIISEANLWFSSGSEGRMWS